MKNIFNKIYLLLLTAIFTVGGYYMGSRDQKIEIAIPHVEASTVDQKSIKPIPEVKQSAKQVTQVKSNVVTSKTVPVQSTTPQPQTTQASVGTDTVSSAQNVVTPAQTVQAPTPKTTVS